MARKKEVDPETWYSWKYPELADMDWRERDQFFLEDLNMTWQQACGSLKKCWKGFYTSRRKGDEDMMNEYARRIVDLQQGMGITEADFGILF